MYALLLYDHLILSEQEGADLCSKVRESEGNKKSFENNR